MRIAYILSTVDNYGPFIVAQGIINNIYNILPSRIEVMYFRKSSNSLTFEANCTKIRFTEKINFSKYDIIHSHGFLADFFMFLNKKRFKGRWITTMHQNIKPDYTMSYNSIIATVLEKVWCKAVNKSDCVVALSSSMVDYYSTKSLIKAKLTYIYNGISCGDLNEIPDEELSNILLLKEQYYILGVSASLTYRKGIDQIIKSLATPNGQKFLLIVIGAGEELQNLNKLANKYKVNDRCIFLGYKNNATAYFKYFDIYVMSSRSEAFGLCVIEAACKKLPIVCSNISVYRELFPRNEVIKFTLENISSLTKALNIALREREKLSSRIFTSYTKNYTVELMAKSYLNLYYELVKPI